MNDQQKHDIKEVAGLAAVTYAVNKAANDSDPELSKGRIGGATYVRNNAEYAGVAAGQLTIAHFLAPLIIKIIAIPTLFIFTFGPLSLLNHIWPRHCCDANFDMTTNAPGAIQVLVVFSFFLLWLYLIFWKCIIKPILKHGPTIVPADGYRGPLGTSQTTWSNRAIPDPNRSHTGFLPYMPTGNAGPSRYAQTHSPEAQATQEYLRRTQVWQQLPEPPQDQE